MFESPYTGRDFVQFGKTKSVLNKRAQGLALLFNPPSVLSLEIMLFFKTKDIKVYMADSVLKKYMLEKD